MARGGLRQYALSSDRRPAKVEGGTLRTAGLVLRTTYPCCGGPARLATVDGIPVEVYERRCPKCDTRWTVRRHRLPASDLALGGPLDPARAIGSGFRADRLDWETSDVEIHARHRRALLGITNCPTCGSVLSTRFPVCRRCGLVEKAP